jgi:hypothetical protein
VRTCHSSADSSGVPQVPDGDSLMTIDGTLSGPRRPSTVHPAGVRTATPNHHRDAHHDHPGQHHRTSNQPDTHAADLHRRARAETSRWRDMPLRSARLEAPSPAISDLLERPGHNRRDLAEVALAYQKSEVGAVSVVPQTERTGRTIAPSHAALRSSISPETTPESPRRSARPFGSLLRSWTARRVSARSRWGDNPGPRGT